MAAAELEAAKNSWQVAVTILDSGGNMVMFHKLDNTQLASIGVSEGKANTALRFKRPRRRSTRPSPPAAPGCACLPSRT
jgi:glc operon protein GlcG